MAERSGTEESDLNKQNRLIVQAVDETWAAILDPRYKLPRYQKNTLTLVSAKLVKLQHQMVRDKWKVFDGGQFINVIDLLENKLDLPDGNRLVGIKLDGKAWLLRADEELKGVPRSKYHYLDNEALRNVYVQCGGSKPDTNF